MLQKAEVVKIKSDIEGLFTDRCDIYEKEEYMEGAATKHREVLVYSSVACRASYSTGMLFNKLSSGKSNNDALKNTQYIKIMLPAEINPKPGSKIKIITQGGEKMYCRSGETACYFTHNEVVAENFKEWS